MIRAILERSTHRIVIKRKLPSPFSAARIYASTEGGLRYLRPTMDRVDPALLRLAEEEVQPGHTVWDVGANLGLFSFSAAVSAGSQGHILAVEPDIQLVGLLRRSSHANTGQAAVDIICAAVADQVGVASFHVARRNRCTSHLDGFGTTEAGGTRSLELVPTVTLDWLAARFPAPDILKIDVEGAELTVLAGGTRLLSDGPTIICEVAGHNSVLISSLLVSHGYTIYDGDKFGADRTPLTIAPPSTLAVKTSAAPQPTRSL
jgi:FkbM family methyltransferase